ncbi:MAG: response regulator [Methanomicrobiales archaeon]|nr:response regulator [Methanomicrobiales archaeon]
MKKSNKRILLVEDDPNDVELILHVFRWCKLGDLVDVVWDGEQALDYLFGEGEKSGDKGPPKPDVILLDLKLPKVSGLEVLRRLKAEPRTKHIPIVVLTSSSHERDVVECYQLGVNSFVTKPVNFNDFSTVIRDLGFYWSSLNITPPDEEDKDKRSP